MKNKKLIVVVLAFVALVGLLAGLWFGMQSKEEAPVSTTGTDASGNTVSGISFTVTVVHADGSEKEFSYTTDAEKLGAFLEEQGLIESEGADDGMFHTVDGEKADWNENQSYWAFYLGQEYAMTGIYDTAIESADYRLVYTIG
jgi:hypothetical protein